MMTRNMLVGGLAVALLGGAAWSWMHRAAPVQYQLAKIERGAIEAVISATGNCNAVVTVQVGSQVSGNITALFADFNTKVKKGQLVARIDPEVFQARVNQAQATLDSSRAQVTNAQAQVRKAEADLASAKANQENLKANIARAKVATLDAKSKLDHRLEMFKERIISAEDRDTAQATLDSAVASEEAANAMYAAGQQSVQAAQAEVEVSKTQYASAQAQVKQAAAALVQAQLDLDHTVLTAPVDGTVVARHMDVGQTVAASFQAPTIFEIAQDLTKMQVDTSVDEADIGRVKVGQTAWFSVDAYPNKEFSGTVTQIRMAPINVQNVVTYDVVVAVPNPDLKLFPGMTANVKILTDHRDNVLRVPNSALRVKLDQPAGKSMVPSVHAASNVTKQRGQKPVSTVYVLTAGSKPVPVRVEAGISDGQYTEVSGNLHEGDQVVIGVSNAKATTAAAAAPKRGPGF